MQSFYNNTINPQYQYIAQEFVKVYYDRMAHHGVNVVFELLGQNVLCTIDSEEFRGSYNWLLKMTRAGVSHFEYRNISGTCQPLTNFEILITVQGNLRAIGLWGQHIGNWQQFNETFVLEKNGDTYQVRNYILGTH